MIQDEQHLARKGYRIIGLVIGLLFVGSGLYVLLTGPLGALQFIGAAAFIAIGVNLLLVSWRGRASWLSKVGPLP